MKKSRILNKYLNEAIADMGHGDHIIIADAGFPIPDPARRMDLAIEKDKPGIVEILELVMSDFIYEACIVAEEQKSYNPLLFQQVSRLADRCKVETIPHAELIAAMPASAKFIVRTGAFEPWGNVILRSGVDAPVWFQKTRHQRSGLLCESRGPTKRTSEMTPRQRVSPALAHRAPDRTPVDFLAVPEIWRRLQETFRSARAAPRRCPLLRPRLGIHPEAAGGGLPRAFVRPVLRAAGLGIRPGRAGVVGREQPVHPGPHVALEAGGRRRL